MVKRKGLDFTEYGLVDARAAKRQRLNEHNNDIKYVLKLQCFCAEAFRARRMHASSVAWLLKVLK